MLLFNPLPELSTRWLEKLFPNCTDSLADSNSTGPGKTLLSYTANKKRNSIPLSLDAMQGQVNHLLEMGKVSQLKLASLGD